MHYKRSTKICNVHFAQLYYYMQKRTAVSMHRIPVKMRNYIPYYFVEKMKSNTAVVVVVLIVELLRSEDDDALWKTSKVKGPNPRQQSNDDKKFILRKYDALRDHKKKPCLRTPSLKVFVIFYNLHILNFIFCFQFSPIKLVTSNTL